jgi:alginate O-acetyltransferase complex protein AlgI
MLFTTTTFVLLFLPLVLAGFFALGRRREDLAAAWLLVASLVFYGYWMPEFTSLLVLSIALNFAVGLRILRSKHSGSATTRRWLTIGIVFNLALLGYFKYANFFVDNLGALLGSPIGLPRIILPIGISFYTFTQIAFLVDTYQGKVGETRWIHYGLFVTYFPHLIAGPVLHHAQMMPQFGDRSIYRVRIENVSLGMFVFTIGLFKKIVLADGIAPYADAVFGTADAGGSPSTRDAWLGTVAYTLQLYFDFSGYSDMAIGLSWMFNVRLPYNFDSPYRALSIADFWRRWHISLSTFLRDYLYVPLGGNRNGPLRRYANLMTTMLLGGLWHGASWSFVAWGGLHGIYLMINHGFRSLLGPARTEALSGMLAWRVAAWVFTMLAVVVAWVFFRATSFEGAGRILLAMFGQMATPDPALILWNAGLSQGVGALWCGALGLIAVALPNSNAAGEYMRDFVRRKASVAPALLGGALVGTLMLVVVNAARDSVSAFIYFNF